MSIQLHTNRLTLAPPRLDFAPAILDYFSRNKDHLEPWMPLFANDFYTLDFQTQRLKGEILDINRGAKWTKYLFHKDDVQFEKIIGYISCSQITRGPFQSGYIGYSVDKNETGKGILTEALAEFISYLFTELNLHRVEANIIPRNEASIRVVEKLGFTKEGFSKAYLEINGKWEDHFRFAMINGKWQKPKLST